METLENRNELLKEMIEQAEEAQQVLIKSKSMIERLLLYYESEKEVDRELWNKTIKILASVNSMERIIYYYNLPIHELDIENETEE